ncbi:hypothetical protein [Candidatus Poriferisodalis sp.]|uniref:hypothetical protein n=1 Tax=Candidatus Poriferisodalis sp. TaxID=3101277 RepID=UPI003B5284CD
MPERVWGFKSPLRHKQVLGVEAELEPLRLAVAFDELAEVIWSYPDAKPHATPVG